MLHAIFIVSGSVIDWLLLLKKLLTLTCIFSSFLFAQKCYIAHMVPVYALLA